MLDYVNLFTYSLITKEELIEYRELTDQKIRNLQAHRIQLEEQIQECANENFVYNLGDKLTKVLKLKELTPQVLHSLVDKATCKQDGSICIQYSFVNQFQET